MVKVSTSFLRLGLNAISFLGLARAARPYFGGQGAILMLHHVGHRAPDYFGGNDHLSIKPEFLQQMLEEFRKELIDLVSLDEALHRLSNPRNSRRFVTLTFDDGYRDNVETAYPILQSFRVPFTLFVCTGFVDRITPIWWLSLEKILQQAENLDVSGLDLGREQFACSSKLEKRRSFQEIVYVLKQINNDDRNAVFTEICKRYDHHPMSLVGEEMSTWEMLQTLSTDPLVTIGSHTINHPFLPTLDDDLVIAEMTGARDRLKEMLGIDTAYFAYPYGFKAAVSERDVRLARECGFKAALTTSKGLLTSDGENALWQLPRVSVNGHYQDMNILRALLSGLPYYLANRFVPQLVR